MFGECKVTSDSRTTISRSLLPWRRKVFTCAALLFLVSSSCLRREPPTGPMTPANKSLQLLTTYSLSITEPSGLAYVPATQSL